MMQLLDRERVRAFLVERNRGPTPDALKKEFDDDGFYQEKFAIPVEAGALLGLCRQLFRQERESPWTMITAESSAIWPSWEDANLYRMMRQARGLSVDIAYGDGHLFDRAESDDMVSFAYVFASFRYDFRIIDTNREIHAFFSHDDFLFVQVAEKLGPALQEITNYADVWPSDA